MAKRTPAMRIGERPGAARPDRGPEQDRGDYQALQKWGEPKLFVDEQDRTRNDPRVVTEEQATQSAEEVDQLFGAALRSSGRCVGHYSPPEHVDVFPFFLRYTQERQLLRLAQRERGATVIVAVA
jgi:hypothetical protein